MNTFSMTPSCPLVMWSILFFWSTIISITNGFSRTRPNFIILITDDQDLELGSIDIMPNLHSKIIKNGVTLSNAFVSTPICCPSRTETMTGRYYHNVGAPNGNCMHVDGIGAVFNDSTMFKHFHSSGYTTGIFGKFVANSPKYWCPEHIAPTDFNGYDVRIFLQFMISSYGVVWCLLWNREYT